MHRLSERGRRGDAEPAVVLTEASPTRRRCAPIKRFHTQAKKSIDQAADQVCDLVSEVRDALDELEAHLHG